MTLTRRTALIAGLASSSTAFGQPRPPVTISGVTGHSDSVGVANGRWTGQPMANPRSNAYLNYYVVAAPTNAGLNVDTGTTYFWTISGNNFGTTRGSVWLLDSSMNSIPSVSITIQSWSNTQIRVVANAPHTFTATGLSNLWVSRLTTRPVPASNPDWTNRAHPVVGLIQSRGYGQCTWFVARTRLAQGLRIPTTAYTLTGTLSGIGGTDNYVPQQWDCLAYGTRHVAIITSQVNRTQNANGSLTYSFTVREMNALTDEQESSSTRQYRVSAAVNGRRSVLQMIGSNAGATYVATGYFR
jgi:hypothetical protein